MADNLSNIQNYQEFVERQLAMQKRMNELAEQVKEIDAKSGEKILAAIGTVGLNSIGIPIKFPDFFGYAFLGPIGIFFSAKKLAKLKPLYTELKTLETQYRYNAETYNKLQTDTVTKEAIKANAEILYGSSAATGNGTGGNTGGGSGTSAGGIIENIRSANLSTNELILIIAFVLLLVFLYKKSQPKK